MFSVYIKSDFESKCIYYVAASNPKYINISLNIINYDVDSNELTMVLDIETNEDVQKSNIEVKEKLRLN